jgi:hypothetical protein
MKELKKMAVKALKEKGSVTLIFGTGEIKVVDNIRSLNRMFELAEFFDGIKKIK